MTTFVLVHGGWTRAHGWRAVRKLLGASGHEIFTPSLTGIGERVHLASPQVDLTTHVNDVVNQIVFEDLHDIVLVGYSYGGMVVTAAVEHVRDRIRELVYLDAFVPSDGVSAFVAAIGFSGPIVIGLGDDWLVPPPERDYDDPDEAEWQRARRVAHPVRCFTEPVHLEQPLERYPFGLTYIKATGEPRDSPGGAAFWDAAERAQASPRWRYYEIDTNHMVASNRPAELAQLLVEIAGTSSSSSAR
jgi:pimeloyl-ACP methyl ester carboxylesterase